MSLTHMLLAAATLLNGLLAGLDFDRALVAMPAWTTVGPQSWAEFSRLADLGNGFLLYPVEAIGAAVLTLAAIVAYRATVPRPTAASVLLYSAFGLSVLGLLVTIKAAPIMLGIGGATDPQAIRSAFDGFRYWGDWRALFQVSSFAAQVLALAALPGKATS